MNTTFDNQAGDHADDDPLAARLRAALITEADMVTPSDDGLQQIRLGIADSPARRWWQHPAMPALAAAAVLAVFAGGIAIMYGGDGADQEDVVATQPTGAQPKKVAPSESPEPVPTVTATPVPIEGDASVYYVHDDGDGPRLYREQRPNIGMDPVQMALTAMLLEPALDPDYESLWAGAELISAVTLDGKAMTVDVSVVPKKAQKSAALAMQQLVYNVTANSDLTSVSLLVDGQVPASPDFADPVKRAPMVDVHAFISLTQPGNASIVTSPVTIAGSGTANEGTISWVVRDEAGSVVAENFTQGGSMGEFADFTVSVELEPGSYVVEAFEASAEDGRPIHVDSKSFTVE